MRFWDKKEIKWNRPVAVEGGKLSNVTSHPSLRERIHDLRQYEGN